MPTNPFFEVSPVQRHVGPPADASDYTRFVRLAATVGPYINNGVSAAPTLGWKSPELSAQVRTMAPIYGLVRGFIPNAK
jgi:hypothetical protein